MNILVSCMGYDGGKSGISTYMKNVVKYLKESPHHFTLVVEKDSIQDFAGFKTIVVPKIFSKSLLGMLWHFFILPFYTLNRTYDCILILAASRRYLAFSKIPQVGVIHDLSAYRVEGKYDPLRMFYLRKIQPWLGRRLNQIVAISESTKKDIEYYWNVPITKVTLNYNGLNEFSQPDDRIQSRCHLSKYILYVSRIEYPGKNHIGLIQAFEALPAQLRQNYQLVIAGTEWKGAKPVIEYAQKSPCHNQIIFTGFVSNAELTSLYTHALLFVFPSFSEGFGLPLIEAMSFGIPCACSNTSALGEIGKDAALLFDPINTDQIRDSIQQILTQTDLRNEIIHKGLRRAAQFDWKKHVYTLCEICKKEYDINSHLQIFDINFVNGRIDEILHEISSIISHKQRKKIAFINTHYLNTAYTNPEQRERLNRFDYVLPDGSGVYLACKILGYRYRDNLNGTDLLPLLCKLFEEHGYSIYFFGSKKDVAERAAKNLLKLYPKLKIVGIRSGYFTKEEEPLIIEEINRCSPNFLLVGFGVILQERWIDMNFDKLNCQIASAMGGILDVYSGDAPRGNPLLHKLGLEWVRRLYNEPSRLAKRYLLGNPLFLWRVIKTRFISKKY